MSKEILRFKGLTLDRDEQQAQHGELSLSGGVELHDGALRPSVLQGSMVPNALKNSNNIAKLLYVHETASYRHFIGAINQSAVSSPSLQAAPRRSVSPYDNWPVKPFYDFINWNNFTIGTMEDVDLTRTHFPVFMRNYPDGNQFMLYASITATYNIYVPDNWYYEVDGQTYLPSDYEDANGQPRTDVIFKQTRDNKYYIWDGSAFVEVPYTPPQPVDLSVNPSSLSFNVEGGSLTFDVTSDVDWSISADSGTNWLTSVSPDSHTNSGSQDVTTVTVVAPANTRENQRTGTLIISDGYVTEVVVSLSQAGTAASQLTVSPSALDFDTEGGSESISVQSNVSWTASKSAGSDWLTVSPLSGSNNGTLSVEASANTTGSARSATITIVGGGVTQTVTVTQDADDAHTLCWFDKDGVYQDTIHNFTSDGDIISINSVGNTLIVLTTTGVHYVLWKDGGYVYLGDQIPFMEILFRLDAGHKAVYDRSTVESSGLYTDEVDAAWRKIAGTASDYFSRSNDLNHLTIQTDKQAEITEAVRALINQTNNTVAKDGHFYAPFFIRYCYRLYDGSMVMHSAPLFMNVAMPYTYSVYCFNFGTDINNDYIYLGDSHQITDENGHIFTIDGVVLQYKPSNVGIEYQIQDLSGLKNWSDIVKSVDIFVSPQLPREDFSEKITVMDRAGKYYGARANELKQLISNYTDSNPNYTLNVVFDIPLFSDEAYLDKISNVSNFYKIKSINTEDLSTTQGFVALDYDKTAVANITTQEEMKDDYHSHYALVPTEKHNSGMYVYNHRLNLYGVSEKLFQGFAPYMMVNMASDPNNPQRFNDIVIDAIYIELNTEDGKKYVKKTGTNLTTSEFLLSYSVLFYPDERADRMFLHRSSGGYFDLKMKPHNFLNGAISTDLFYVASHQSLSPNAQDLPSAMWNEDTHKLIPMPNKVVTSEVDDPYYFPLEGRNTVGLGSIIGLAAVTRALSQGQVGDHDLVVFATDGIWVMKVSREGTYNSIHNISREVCTNPKSICQLDQSIVFATERRLARFVESDVASISDMLDGPIPNWAQLLPALYGAFPSNGTEAQQIIHRLLDFGTPAVELFNTGSVFYDYASSRIVVLPKSAHRSGKVAMVFSISDRTWSTMPIPAILSVVPGYPSPFVQLGGSGTDAGKVMILDKPYDYSDVMGPVPGLIITRELTFSDTMDVIRGFTQYSDIDDEASRRPTVWVFGSNNQRTWKQIGFSNRWFYNYMPGYPFRFFRIAVYMPMKPSEEYQQLELEIINKYRKL